MAIDADLQKALDRLDKIKKNAAPRAIVQTINKVGGAASAKALKAVAKDPEVDVPVKALKKRTIFKKAAINQAAPFAMLRIRRGALAMINAGNAPTVIQKGKRAGSLKIGRHYIPGGFIADGSKGKGAYSKATHTYEKTTLKRRHVFVRDGKERYPITLQKIQLSDVMRREFDAACKEAWANKFPTELKRNIEFQISRYFTVISK